MKLGAMLVAAAMLAAAAPASASPLDRWEPHVREASNRFGIPPDWIRRVIVAESGGRTMLDGRPITSRAGAMGLMQLMPGTWAEIRSRLGLGDDPHAPRENILAGTFYLRQMYERFGYPGLFAAYNAGPGRYAEHLRGRALPAETRAYVRAVAGTETGTAPGFADVDAVGKARPSLFAILRNVANDERLSPPDVAAASLFAPAGRQASARIASPSPGSLPR
ncbi:MAG: lytic transglycosylase domain-containing protein [Allosphingosinicella sp.]|uniref:lytic transglycosylase domain-containing protein n=1 Tax=Allosphingosinicella sp. TaxID=2823234 RepID=UPI00394C7AB1